MTAERPPGGSEGKAHSCAGVRRDGTACTASVEPPQTHCWHHDPKLQEQRKAYAANAARSKSKPPRIVQVQDEIRDAITQVKRGELQTSKAQVMSTGYGVLVRALEQERKQKELVEYAERIEALEEAQRRRNGFRSV